MVDKQSLFVSRKKKGNRARAAAIYLACLYSASKNYSEIANTFTNTSNNGIAKPFERIKTQLARDKKLSKEINDLNDRIGS